MKNLLINFRKELGCLCLLSALMLTNPYSFAQFSIENGAQVICEASPVIVLEDLSWQQSGLFSPGESKVIFRGNMPVNQSNINGSGISFFDLEVDKALNDLILGASLEVQHELIFSQGNIDLNGFQLDLINSGRLINEAETRRAYSSRTGGLIFRMEDLNQPNAANPGNLGLIMTTSSNLGLTLVSRGHDPQNVNGQTGILRYYDLTPGVGGSTEGDIEFRYFDGELNGLAESSLGLFSKDFTVSNYFYYSSANSDSMQNFFHGSVLLTNSRWTLAGKNAATSQNPPIKQAELKIVPNPTIDRAIIEFNMVQKGQLELELYDLNGRKLWENSLFSGGGMQRIELDATPFPKGLYLLTLKDNHTLIDQIKMVKK